MVYMLFLICLDPLLNKRVKANYQEHTNEDVSEEHIALLQLDEHPETDDEFNIVYFSAKDEVTLSSSASGLAASASPSGTGIGAGGSSIHPLGVRGNVLNRVGHQQDKWKRQVREQRKNIYDRHTMLN